MNDFSKDELIDLKYGIDKIIAIGSCDSSWNKDMRDLEQKLKSMIENYCEHKDCRSISDIDYVLVCCACDELIGCN